MIVLGLDTATRDTAVAVAGGGVGPIERSVGPGDDGRPRHGPALLPLIEEAVDEAGGWDVIERIAIGIGPGSFTGIRIGVATGRALGQARGLPLAAVQSTGALAAGIPAQGDRPRLAVIDARRGEAFAALIPAGARRAEGPRLVLPELLGEAFPDLMGGLAAGDGAVRFRSELEAAGAEVPPDEDPVHRLSARWVCDLGETAPAGTPEEIKPLYLRAPDAERWQKRDGGD